MCFYLDMKLFVFDIDGTLLNDQKKINDSTKKAIELLHKQNHKVVLCTGRTPIQAHEIIKELKLKDYLIGNNGACWLNLSDNSTWKSNHTIPYKTRKLFYKIAKKLNRELLFSDGFKYWRVYFGNNPKSEIKDELYFIGGTSKEPIYDDWKQIKKIFFKSKDIVQVSVKMESTLLPQYLSIVKERSDNDIEIFETSRVYIQALNINNNKWNGIQEILKKENQINEKDIYCFGDSDNDLSMIRNCVNGIAMGNACEVLKQHAKEIIGNNNDDSIYEFLKSKKLI